MADVVSGEEILEAVDRCTRCRRGAPTRASVARTYRFADGKGDLGVITSVSRPFCGDCTRARLGVDGRLYTCLFATAGVDLREPLRSGADDDALRRIIAARWKRPRRSLLRAARSRRRRGRAHRDVVHRRLTMDDITVLVFGPLRERVGVREIHVAGGTVQEVWDELVRRHPAAAVDTGSIRVARNLGYCEWSTVVSAATRSPSSHRLRAAATTNRRCGCGSPTLPSTSRR